MLLWKQGKETAEEGNRTKLCSVIKKKVNMADLHGRDNNRWTVNFNWNKITKTGHE